MPDTADIAVWIEKLEKARLPSRRTSPDLAAQLRQTLRRPVDRVLCIAADLDAGVDLLSSIGRHRGHEIRGGLGVLRQLVPAKPRIIEPRRSAAAYPTLDPSILVRRLFKRRLRSGALPTEVGVLMLDAITAIQIAAIAAQAPIPPLPVVIDDRRSGKRFRLEADPAETVIDLLRRAGALAAEEATSPPGSLFSLIHGAPLQERLLDPLTPVGQTELWIHVRAAMPLAPLATVACTRCGECVAACPVSLHPAMLLEASQRRDRSTGERFHMDSCIECGLCSVTCPSRLPVLASIRELKKLPA